GVAGSGCIRQKDGAGAQERGDQAAGQGGRHPVILRGSASGDALRLAPSSNGKTAMGAQWKAKGKAQAADARGKLFGRLAKDIMVAARNGADPASNSRLRLVVEQARKVSMPKETLERAIKKGAGLTGETVNFEHVVYEGFAPHQVPVMVECLTDNVKRTAPEMRVLFRAGQLGTSGSVSWDFDHVGMIEAEPAAPGADAEVAAIEAGAQDFEAAGED